MIATYPIEESESKWLLSKLDESNRMFVLRQNDKPKFAVLNWTYFEELSETLEILNDKNLVASIQKGLEDVEGKRLHSLDDLLNELL